MGAGWLLFGIAVASIALGQFVSTLFLYLGAIAFGVVLAFGYWNVNKGAALVGALIAVIATYYSGVI